MRRLLAGFVFVALLFTVASPPVSALTVKSKPAQASILKITSKSSKVKNKVDVSVSFGRSQTHVRAPLLSSQVKVGAATCTASGKSTNCTLRNLPSGKIYKVSVRSRNKNGFGSWSKAVSYLAKNGSMWSLEAPRSTTTLPPSSTTTLPPVAAKGLFDVGDAVGLFVASANSVSTFGVRAVSSDLVLKKITPSGTIQNVATDSSVTMRNFYIAPNDKIYALGVNWRDLKTREWKSCFILEVNKDSAESICILQSSEEATGLRWGGLGSPLLNASSALQFDRNGAVYFMISPKDPAKEVSTYTSYTSQYVRRYLNGVSTDFGIGYIADGQPDCNGISSGYQRRDTISSFHVMDDGTLLVDQLREQRVWQCDPDSPWAGRPYTRTTDIYGPDGSFLSVEGCSYCQFDNGQRRNRIGFFLNKDSETVLANYEIINIRTGQITGRYFGDESISPSFTSQSVGCPPSGSSVSLDGPDGYFQEMVCFYGAENWEKSFSLLGGPRFAQIRKNNDQPESVRGEFAILVQVTPQMRRVASQVKKVVDTLPILDKILISGVDDSGLFSTVLYNPSNSTERILLGTDLNIRVHKMSFDSKSNTMYATGERRSNGEKVLAIVKMTDLGEVQIRKIEGEILNLQSFGS